MTMAIDYSKIFDGTAKYYAKYRRKYPPEVFNSIAKYYKLTTEPLQSVMVDFGCGTGEIAIPLAKYFNKVVCVDASKDMLYEAQKRATNNKVNNIEFINSKAEEFDLAQAQPFLVTAAVSFHWMDQPLLLNTIWEHVSVGGGFVIIDDNSPVRGTDKTEDWKMKRKEIIFKYLGEYRRAGDYLYKDIIYNKVSFEDRIIASKFKTYEFKSYEYTTTRTIDDLLGFLYSTSYAAKRLFGDRAEEFENEFRKELLHLVPDGKFVEPGLVRMYLTIKA